MHSGETQSTTEHILEITGRVSQAFSLLASGCSASIADSIFRGTEKWNISSVDGDLNKWECEEKIKKYNLVSNTWGAVTNYLIYERFIISVDAVFYCYFFFPSMLIFHITNNLCNKWKLGCKICITSIFMMFQNKHFTRLSFQSWKIMRFPKWNSPSRKLSKKRKRIPNEQCTNDNT